MVNNGREAVATASTMTFDLILMDVDMPEMDGLEATGVLREREKGIHPHTPIMAMTAHAMKGDAERCLAAGMDAYISKPVQPRELFEKIEGLLRSRLQSPAPDQVAVDGEEARRTYDGNCVVARDLQGGD